MAYDTGNVAAPRVAQATGTAAATAPPERHELVRKQQQPLQTAIAAPDNTCGYMSGLSSQVACVGGGAGFTTRCDSACQADTAATRKCTGSTDTYCVTLSFGAGTEAYWCTNSPGVTWAVSTTYPGQLNRTFTTSVIDAVWTTSLPFASGAATTAPASSARSRPTPATPTTYSIPTIPSINSSSGGSNTGAIPGGVVGGVAALALMGLGIWLARRRSRNKQSNTRTDDSGHLATPGQGPQELSALGGGGARQLRQKPELLPSSDQLKELEAGGSRAVHEVDAPFLTGSAETGGDAVGERNVHDHHQGELHELA
ncbi:uncharacterized protein B0I36DRAFT_384797 [Microdochium trichocladiopsis]|uniref:Uncharacterized protein n=1 Tax=Microdochium trichocladiopsis TaxID=1682393 RepID=A0A9P8Y4K2_9PEZI|nr:uncharacterized protein B0I36DRAFT_384797 [Microdochium trichocladiopsis]KAH7029254.1 hypothetical protein B0I36DRAFT_384797 [Microdochium trichocladiopsis]